MVDHAFKIFNYDHNPGSKRALILKLRAKALRLRHSAISQDVFPMEETAGCQDFSGDPGEYGALSNWSTSGDNDLFAWDSVLGDFNLQS